jgi:hypothetical protein
MSRGARRSREESCRKHPSFSLRPHLLGLIQLEPPLSGLGLARARSMARPPTALGLGALARLGLGLDRLVSRPKDVPPCWLVSLV